ncbi:MAG TPA: hypothetical protein VF628_07845 [Allosphingosinicella sp.]|jgi:hypothetical protein
MPSNRILLSAACLLLLPACTQWKATARINPSTVAVYPGAIGAKAQKRNGTETQPCPLSGGFSDSKRGAINLDCFQLPEDSRHKRNITAYERATPDHWSERAQSEASGPTAAKDALQIANAHATNSRNRLNAILVKHADDVCVLEKGRLVATESSANFLLSFLT